VPFYEFDVVIPAGTTYDNRVEVLAPVEPGHVVYVAVHYPPGPAGLAFTACDRFASQIWPDNSDGEFKGDGLVIDWLEDYPVDDHPLMFRLFGWAPNARFQHTVTWRLNVLPLDQAQEAAGLPSLLSRVADAILGRGR
jgi:hypothetical protein